MRTLVWFRGKDLRVADHAPLREAAKGELIPLFVLDPYFFAPDRARLIAHRMQYLLDALGELAHRIRQLGSRLVLVEGKSVDVVPKLAKEWRVDRVVAYRWVEPFARERDRRVANALDVPFDLFEGETLLKAGSLLNAEGEPYSVYTPFARAALQRGIVPHPVRAPTSLPALPIHTTSAHLPTCASLGIQRNPYVLAGGETEAHARLRKFARIADRYATARDRMDVAGTSRLSQDLKFGTLSVATAWKTISNTTFRRELLWRELTHSILWHRPDVLTHPFRAAWEGFPWRRDERAWNAWATGHTGYPIVDAAARQLVAEGFVHNRARMIAASFLTKHLLIDFRRGEAHYMKYLTDGDWAQNDAGWQWSAGCGCDAQPWFRIFNPVAQSKKFDPNGDYIRRWLPERAHETVATIHEPRNPIVDHAAARARFLNVAKNHLNQRSAVTLRQR
jgi:deoxyribodipyrimidine photo-lyase